VRRPLESDVANRLASETSPYLVQHRDNPVDWYPWGPEALSRAAREDKPILLSIGYSSCHWCHVMAHESFEDPAIAAVMNTEFINVKVDREERPDLDAIYMQITVAMTGAGGWPMTVFLTSEGVPFYAGTYFPPADRFQMPSFRRVIGHVAEAYRSRRDSVDRTVRSVLDYVREGPRVSRAEITPALMEACVDALRATFDSVHGGFGGAPKFPPAMAIEFLLRHHRRTGSEPARVMAEETLARMARGGMYDQIGGGFHRYSVDAEWHVPHFEKMLYDNAQLASAYTSAFLLTREKFYARIAEETLDYVIRDLSSPEGGFYSSEDADSEGVEGKFYVWTPDQITGSDDRVSGLVRAYYDITPEGNWEQASIPRIREESSTVAGRFGMDVHEMRAAIDAARKHLLSVRSARVRPGRDEKVLASWNGMCLRAMADAAAVLGRERYLLAAEGCAGFILRNLVTADRVHHSFAQGRASQAGFLEDHACVADGLLALYEATADERWFTAARRVTDSALAHFSVEGGPGLFDTADDHEVLIARPRDLFDNATPAASSVMADVLLRLARMTGDAEYYARAEGLMSEIAGAASGAPTAFGRWLSVMEAVLFDPPEIAIVGPPDAGDTAGLLGIARQRYLPGRVIGIADPRRGPSSIPLLHGRDVIDGRATAYVCRRGQCRIPTTDAATFARQLDGEQGQSLSIARA